MRAGDIHIWDRESASYLHHISAPALGGEMTCIAWNPTANPFMFATGSHDGTVQIWTTPETPQGHSRPALPMPRTETAPAPQRVEPSVMHLAVPVMREPSHRYIPRLKLSSSDTIENVVPPYEIVGAPFNTLTLRRHSWM